MAEKKAKSKKAVQPHFDRSNRKRCCGKWVDKDYEPTDEEKAKHARRQDIQKKRKADIAKVEKK